MSPFRRSLAYPGALLLLVLASCVDSDPTAPGAVVEGPSLAIVDGTTSGSSDFYFLPPISQINPTITGEFNPELSPVVRVCELDGEPGTQSSCVRTVAEFPPGAAEAGSDFYQLGWDTDGPENSRRLQRRNFYRLEVLVADSVFGWVDLAPVGSDEIADSGPNGYAYAFRIGETIPVKFFLSTQTLCAGESFVTECITGAVIDQEGGTLNLDGQGNRLGVIIAQNSLPEPFEAVTVTVERIDPVAFFNATGEQCIPGVNGIGGAEGDFDAPQFGDCFRVTTYPELDNPLLAAAVVSICLDVSGLGLSSQQVEQLRMVKFSDSDETWTALQETAGDCPVQQASLLQVPDRGVLRYAAMGVNALARAVLPQPLEARAIRFGGFNSSFSRFRFALPGEMTPTAGDGVIIQQADDNTITATVNVLDAGDDLGQNREPVVGARVQFTPASGAGTVSATEVITDALGNATVQWTVDRTTAGEKVLTASALGLFGGPLPDPDGVEYDFVAESVTLTATVVGQPSQIDQDPADNIDDAVAGVPQPLKVIVTDSGNSLVEGATVTWTCTPVCTFGEGTQNADGSATTTSTTDASGEAFVDWTPFTAGSQVTVAGVGIVGVDDATFTATVGPAAPSALQPSGGGVTQTVGTTTPLSVKVVDEFGNGVPGQDITWSGDGALPTSSTSDGSGVASATWTLGTEAGPQAASAQLGALTAQFTATGTPDVAFDLAPSGGGGEYEPGTLVPLSITVTDQYGNARVGDTVLWSSTSGSIPGDAVTATGGVASANWTLGTEPGPFTASVMVGGLTEVFNATIVGCGTATWGTATLGDATFDADEWECAGSLEFTANIDGGVPATLYWMNDEDDLFLALRLQQSSASRANSLRFDFDNDADGVTELNDDAIEYDADTGQFLDEHLDQECLNRSQAGCGQSDAQAQGAGDFFNDGTWSTYELSHPLTGGGNQDISVSGGDQLRFFLTLRNGNGAKGNTQFPQFRDYLDPPIEIAGSRF